MTKSTVKNILFYSYLPLLFFFYELAVKFSIFGFALDKPLLYIFIFSTAIGGFFTAVISLLPRKWAFGITVAVSSLSLIYYAFILLYYKFFKDFFLWQTIGLASGFITFWKQSLGMALKNWYFIVILALPLLFLCIFGRKSINFERKSLRTFLIILPICIAVFLSGCGFAYIDSAARPHFYETYSVGTATHNFGVAANTFLEFKYMMFGNADIEIDIPVSEPESEPEQEQKPVEYNKMDIDFDELIANETDSDIIKMHEYFKNCIPTAKNDYTGMFEGKNLIVLTLEGFTNKCIDPVLTPTLYKLSTEGFVFENFYLSQWGGSTASGEYAAVTGNFYNAATALRKSDGNAWPFTLGNQFSKLGYTAKSYHNHTYTYYYRHLAHAAYGYDYKGVGNGLEGLTKCWPESDLEMMDITVSDYIDAQPFVAYYMTVSGHCEYTFNDNMMSYKNRDAVADMDASSNVKAYYACQIELDKALESLINQLDAAGILDNTVIAMCADHYPYALEDDDLAELYGLEQSGIRNNFDLYRNGLIIWSSSMTEPVTVTKPCSSIDLLPTLSNLFGLEYDSRLIMGSDILSDTDSPVILNSVGTIGSNHWITAYGSYNYYKGEFTPSADCPLTGEELDEYVKRMTNIVLAKEKYSLMILDENYYAKVFK